MLINNIIKILTIPLFKMINVIYITWELIIFISLNLMIVFELKILYQIYKLFYK